MNNIKDKAKSKSRLNEIISKIKQKRLITSPTPVKLRETLQELGPTFIKFGQIMSSRPDILPKEYCDELENLRCDVPPMPFEDVRDIIESSCEKKLEDIFESIKEAPIGSASIAQVHSAVLKNGQQVVVKVQRKGIKDIMSRDVELMHRLTKIVPPQLKTLTDIDALLDEFWRSAQEEMDFLHEQGNLEAFAENNKAVAFVTCPRVYKEFTTTYVLVMEKIDGIDINDKKALLQEGYSLKEIGEKLADNFVKQIVDDGFFHADPHPGNLKIRDGKIVWLDMGMMGTLNKREQLQITAAVKAIAKNDIGTLVDVVLALGIFKERPSRSRLYEDVKAMMTKYCIADLGSINIANMLTDLIEVMRENSIAMPSNLTLLARGMATIEGVVADLSPDVQIIEIAAARSGADMFKAANIKNELMRQSARFAEACSKAIDIPIVLSDILKSYRKGETRIKLDLHATDDLARLIHHITKNLVLGLIVCALLIASSILCTTDVQPQILHIPFLSILGFAAAVGIMLYMLYKHYKNKRRRR